MLLDGASSGGTHSAARLVCPPGLGAPPHRHVEAETFHVVRGTRTVHADGARHELHPGDLIHVRPWVVHHFGNGTAEPVEFLAFGAPAGHERFFADADALARSGRFNPETAAEVCRRHGIELVTPSPAP